MHKFIAKCDEALAEISAQGRYRRFVALEKLADQFPYFLRPGLLSIEVMSVQ
jgi:5-aminolevulinate synthase